MASRTAISRIVPEAPAQQDIPLVSLVVPVFDEQDAITPFLERIGAVFDLLAPEYDYEIVFVNDGSRDATEFAIRTCMTHNTHVHLINLSRNFGKEQAIRAGLARANGEAVIVMDGDLQHPPTLIPKLVDTWDTTGCDVVHARKDGRGAVSTESRPGHQ